MKIRTILLALVVIFAATIVASAQNLHIGTWKLNEAKSKFAKDANKNHTVVYETSGDMIKVTVDGTDANGDAIHNEWTGKFDGKFYAVTGTGSEGRMRSYKMLSSRTLALREKANAREGRCPNNGRVVQIPAGIALKGTIMIAKDGKSRTVVTNATNPCTNKNEHNLAVYDKQ
jgi:hypothetical protein